MFSHLGKVCYIGYLQNSHMNQSKLKSPSIHYLSHCNVPHTRRIMLDMLEDNLAVSLTVYVKGLAGALMAL